MARLGAMPSRLGAAPARVRCAPKQTDNFYRSPPWLGLMRQLKRKRGNRCQDCGAKASKTVRIIGDHIHERKDGGADLDPANIRLLCLPCHNRKTAKAKAKRLSQ